MHFICYLQGKSGTVKSCITEIYFFVFINILYRNYLQGFWDVGTVYIYL